MTEEQAAQLRGALMNAQPPAEAHEIWKHGFLVAMQSAVAIVDHFVQTDGTEQTHG